MGNRKARMTESQPQLGGIEWELQSAWDLIVASRLAHDTDQEGLAWRRYSEGLRNASMAVVGQVLVPVAGQIKDLAEIVSNARQADLSWRTEERTLRDAQSDRLYTELDRLAAATEEAAHGLGKFQQDLDALRAGQTTYSARLDEMDIRHTGQWEEAMTLLAESKEDRADLRRMYEARAAERATEHQRYMDEIKALADRVRALEAGGN